MQEKIKLRLPVVVEGKYDRLRLQELIDELGLGANVSLCGVTRDVAGVLSGAKGFLLKDSDFKEVVDAIACVRAGGNYICRELLTLLSGRLRTPQRPQPLIDGGDDLSSREQEILVRVCRGLSNQEIADELFISKRTVDKHRANILEKTGCKNTANLVVWAIKNSVVAI